MSEAVEQESVPEGHRIDDSYITWRVRRNHLFTIATIILLIIGLELVGRGLLFVKRSLFPVECYHLNEVGCPTRPWDMEQGEGMLRNPYTGYSWMPNYEGEWLVVNSLGFRDDEFEIEKPKGTFRVVMVGSSAVAGAGVHNDETIPYYLEQILSEELDQPVEVINAGVAGYIAAQDLTHIQFDVLQLDPDMVIVYNGRNDLYFSLSSRWQPNYPPSLQELEIPLQGTPASPLEWTRFQLSKTAIWTSLNQVVYLSGVNGRREAQTGLSYKVEWAESYEQNMRLIVQSLQLYGLEEDHIIVVAQPSLAEGAKPIDEHEMGYINWAEERGYFDLLSEHYREIPEIVLEISEDTGIQGYDFTPIFDEVTETVYIDEVHLNARGNLIAAEELARILLDVLASR